MNFLFYAFICMYMPYAVVSPYVMVIQVRLKETHFRNLCFSNSLKIEFMRAHFFITKLEVAGMTTTTHELSSQYPTEKSCISHSCVSMSSSEDGVGQCGHLCWVPSLALALQPSADCMLYDEGLYVSWPSVLFVSYESILSPIQAVRGHYFKWCVISLSSPLCTSSMKSLILISAWTQHTQLSLILQSRLTSDSSSSVASRAPPLRRGRGFIRTLTIPQGRGWAHGGGRGDAPEDSRTALFHFEDRGWCEIVHVKLGCEHSSFCL